MPKPLRVVVLLAAVALAVVSPAAAAQAHGLYVYGHSWTASGGLAHPSRGYTRIVARERHLRLHARGVDGSLVHEAEERLLGTGEASWHTGSSGTVLIQANLNTARDFGPDTLALATSRNAIRTMVATVDASRRIEESSRSHHFSRHWRRTSMPWASGGHVRRTTRNGAYVQFHAMGGEYVVVRGVPGPGITLRVSDRSTGHVIARIGTGHQVHPAYSHAGIPVLIHLARSRAGHTIRVTKQSGHGTFWFDGRLPQRRSPPRVVLVEEPHLLDYSLSTAHPNGSDAAIDAFNRVLVQAARRFHHVRLVDPDSGGWDPSTMLQADGVHPDRAGHRFMADLVERVL